MGLTLTKKVRGPPDAYISIRKAYQVLPRDEDFSRAELDLSSRIKTYQVPLNFHQSSHQGWFLVRILGLVSNDFEPEQLRNQATEMANIAFRHYQAYTCYWLPFLGEFHFLIPIVSTKSISHRGSITRLVSAIVQEYRQFITNEKTMLKVDVFHYPQKDTEDIFNYFFFRHSQGKQDIIERAPKELKEQNELLHGMLIKKEETEHYSQKYNETYYRANKISIFSFDFSKVNADHMLNNYLLSQVIFDKEV